jgi:geranylgeranyl pyrophosphate synthase
MTESHLCEELSFLSLVRDDLERVEVLLRDLPSGHHEIISVALDHLVGGGGKRLRPALVFLSAHLCGADIDRATFAATAVEMLHTATLVHDDLIDGALKRRGVETLNVNWSPSVTVLTGDYIFAHAAHLMSRTNSLRLMQRFCETLMVICDGEIRQVFEGRRGPVSPQGYERRVHAKTASLIGLSAEAGGILAGAGEEIADALRDYGERLGLAFQIVDDVLDFVADEETLGKPVGSDLRQGLLTLPLIFFLEAQPGHPAVRRTLQGNSSDEVVQEAVQAVAGSLAIERALEVAEQHAERAKETLGRFSHSPYKAGLLDIADFTVRRRF